MEDVAKKRPSYWEQLKHPKWQRKRLEVLNAAGFKCSRCGDADDTLHVHHSYYERGKAPWDYPTASLHALCEDCHEYHQANMQAFQQQLGRLSLGNTELVYGFAMGVDMYENPAMPVPVFNVRIAFGIAHAFGTNAALINQTVNEAGCTTGQAIIDALTEANRCRESAMADLRGPVS